MSDQMSSPRHSRAQAGNPQGMRLSYDDLAQRGRYWPSLWLTALWVLPAMVVLTGVGYFLGRHVFAPTYLQPSKVQQERLHPIRILSPEEAAAMARDEPSPVWTEGVPPVDTEAPRPRTRRSRATPAVAPSPDAPSAPSADAPATDPPAPAPPAAPTPAPAEAPASPAGAADAIPED
jgi:hypothetical protein